MPKLDRRVLRELVARLSACSRVVGCLRPHSSSTGSVPDDAAAAPSERINYLLAAGMRPISGNRSETSDVSVARLITPAEVCLCT